MKNIKLILIFIACTAILASCKTGKEGSFSNNGIQKRKYTKGYYSSLSLRRAKASKVMDQADAAKQEQVASAEQAEMLLGLSTELKNDEAPLMASRNNEAPAQCSTVKVQPPAKKFLIPSNTLRNKKPRSSKMERKMKDDKGNSVRKADDMLVLYVVLGILLPPLGVYLFEGSITNNFWLDLVLTLFFFLPGIVFALLVILGGVSI